MKKIILLSVFVIVNALTVFSQCPASYSFAATSETVSFTNQSAVPNAHYFWNFGDGTGSNAQNPVHTFPESGRYLVTLFAKDTVSNCATFYEKRLNIIKLSNDICQPDSILDSISYNGGSQVLYLDIIEKSSNCNSYGKQCEAGVNSMMPSPAYLGIFGNPARYVGRVNYSTYDNNINQYVNRRAVYKTIPYRYSSAINYSTCSANFEFKTVSQDANGERILFTAMNKTAASYKWYIFASVNSYTSTSDTVSAYLPFNQYSNQLFMTMLQTVGSNGCKDTLIQTIRVQYKQFITGIGEYSLVNFGLQIYPNPSKDELVISTAVELDKISVVNSIGQEIFVLRDPLLKQVLDVSFLPAGIYFLKAENKQGYSVNKFVRD